MSISTAYWAADLEAMIDDLPATFTLGALSFSCSATDLDTNQMLMLTGFDMKEGLAVVFPASAVASASTALAPNIRVTVQRPGEASARNYAVVTVRLAADNVSKELVLKEDNRA